MTNALIGFSGFVGGTLLKQTHFDALYRSSNIADIAGKEFDCIVCAGAPAQKWLANKEPENDLAQINGLIEQLASTRCKTFILISSVDVFGDPSGVYEDTPVNEEGLHAYGLHRRLLEKFIESHFPHHLIVRLPGLVGPGLKKNIIFDFLNTNNLHAIESRNIFQFYPMVNLWNDIQQALTAGLKLAHLTAEPIQVATVAQQGFNLPFEQALSGKLAAYDMRTRFASVFGASGDYQYNTRETLMAVRAYAQSEPKTLRS
jgi:nucleoside-diphosphate-sugar epimerase